MVITMTGGLQHIDDILVDVRAAGVPIAGRQLELAVILLVKMWRQLQQTSAQIDASLQKIFQRLPAIEKLELTELLQGGLFTREQFFINCGEDCVLIREYW